ncbi:MAG: ABC transporter substrate-binding protein [Actinomycetota bacterium]|nr:ABC transporter substrate-binding protein [Actinomycetota bacterium]
MPFRSKGRHLLLALACVAAACTPGGGAPSQGSNTPGQSDGPGGGRTGAIEFGVLGAPGTLDPYSPSATDLTFMLVRPLFPSLFQLDPRGRPRAMLVRTATATGPRGLQITLRRASWSNGRSITARDVVSSVRRAEPPSGLADVASARAMGRRRVRLTGALDWKRTLATAAPILPSGGGVHAGGVFGGPFELESFTPGLEAVYSPNPNWWGAEPRSDRIVVRFVQDLEIMLALLRSGRLDGAAPPSSVNLGQRLDAIGLKHSSVLGWESLWFDLQGAQMDGAGRAGVARAIDRTALERGLVRSHGRLTNTLHPGPGRGAAEGAWRRPARPPVVTAPSPIQVAVAGGDELAELVQRALRLQLEEAGFSVELVSADAATFYGPWRREDPMDIAIRRTSGAPASTDDSAPLHDSLAVPFAQVETFVAWRDGLRGPAANPTLDGPLWNLERWRLAS